jgi:hypothetical protein
MSTVVTGHRMAFATSGTRTVLWDQIRYTGNPSEFSWVLPIKGDAKLEAATDAWFESLETVTNSRVSAPMLNCFVRRDTGDGCSCGSGANDSSSLSGPLPAGRGLPGEGVIVSHEGSVGPYQFVQVAGGGEALAQWLPRNGYAVPADVQPVIAAYAQEGFGFIALKLQPGQQTKQMTPVRVITEGGGNTLPLRMVAAGTGDFVAITLYVIAEGRYEVDGFASTTIDASKLSWDWQTSQSNYATVRKQALDALGGKAWITGFSQLQAFTKTYNDALDVPINFNIDMGGGTPGGSFSQSFNNLTDLYFAQGKANANQLNNCSQLGVTGRLSSSELVYDNCKGATPSGDGGVPARDAGSLPPASMSCPPSPTGTIAASQLACDDLSDIAAAMIGMHPDTVWLTRLESNLPRASLAADLKIKPAGAQTPVGNTFRAAIHVRPPCDLLENHPGVTALTRRSQEAGLGVASGIGLLFARRLRRRRDRAR